MDFEMAIYEHYYEALDVMGEMFNYLFDGIAERYSHELSVISQQYPFEPMKYLRPPLRITFAEVTFITSFPFLVVMKMR
jgi:aspartyl-tRNA synthetase